MKEKISMPSLRTVQVSWFEDKRVSAPSGDLTLEQVADIICNPKCTFLGGRVLQLTTTARKMLDKGNKAKCQPLHLRDSSAKDVLSVTA